jgi:hypothetical protein
VEEPSPTLKRLRRSFGKIQSIIQKQKRQSLDRGSEEIKKRRRSESVEIKEERKK